VGCCVGERREFPWEYFAAVFHHLAIFKDGAVRQQEHMTELMFVDVEIVRRGAALDHRFVAKDRAY
jgi:hypothetical protein